MSRNKIIQNNKIREFEFWREILNGSFWLPKGRGASKDVVFDFD